MSDQELCFLSACDLAARIRNREISVVEVIRAHLAHIERINPQVNAVVTLTAEQALREATAADHAPPRGEVRGPLHGVPIGYKDLTETAGIRTTFGSPLYRDYVPTQDALVVTRMNLETAVERHGQCVPWGTGQGATRRNSVLFRRVATLPCAPGDALLRPKRPHPQGAAGKKRNSQSGNPFLTFHSDQLPLLGS